MKARRNQIPTPQLLPKGTHSAEHYQLRHESACCYFEHVYGCGFTDRFHALIRDGYLKAVCFDEDGTPIWDIMHLSIALDELLFALYEMDRE